MEDLFRFVATRPAQSADNAPTVALALDPQVSRLQGVLAGIRNAGGPVENPEEPPQPPPAEAMVAEARRFQTGAEPYGGLFVRDLAEPFVAQLVALRKELAASAPDLNLDRLIVRIEKALKLEAPGLPAFVSGELFRQHLLRVFDSIIAIFLAPTEHPRLLRPLTEVAQTLELMRRAGARDARLDSAAAIHAALAASLLLPPQIFPIRPDQIQPVGVADLLVVKQQLKRYELGDISTIENVLRGESRKRADERTLTKDVTRVEESEKTTETTTELTTAERFELKQESESTLKEDLSIKAGVQVTAKYGGVTIDAKTDVAYSTAKSESNKLAQTQARDVTQRAASKVTERIRQQITTRIIETFKQTDERSFDNVKGPENVSGVYQFVNKVYEAQVFNYGKRLLFDLMVPEPAAFLLDAAGVKEEREAPVLPEPLTLRLHDIDWKNPIAPNGYGTLATRYRAVVAAPPDMDEIVVQNAYVGKLEEAKDNDNLVAEQEIPVPEGYIAVQADAMASFNNKEDGNSGVGVIVGDNSFNWSKDQANNSERRSGNLLKTRSVAIAIHSFNTRDYSLTVNLKCTRLPLAFEKWQFETYSAIQTAFRERVEEYEEKLAAQSFQAGAGAALGGGNPGRNREVERDELKKGAIALIGQVDLLGFDGIDDSEKTDPPTPPRRFPRPAGVAQVQQQARVIRFFEQAFEWEQMTYVFYPYFWGRRETWYDRVQQETTDPTFGQFLRAGSARMVVPVRPGFEADLRYFLLTGLLWGGADLPDLTDPTYLPITQEIKELTGAPGDEVPQGKPWDIRLPTDLVKLRPDGKLPQWERSLPDKWIWKPGTPTEG